MANIVELREMSDDKLEEMLENAREEMFNLRFQQATAQLDNHARVRIVRREIAQVETVLHMRKLAIDTAAIEPDIAAALSGMIESDALVPCEVGKEQGNMSGFGGRRLVGIAHQHLRHFH